MQTSTGAGIYATKNCWVSQGDTLEAIYCFLTLALFSTGNCMNSNRHVALGNKAIEFLDFVMGASSIETIWALHVERMAEYGFDRLLYGFNPAKPPNSWGHIDDCLILTNYPADYVRHFFESGLYRSASTILWTIENVGAASWRDIEAEAARAPPRGSAHEVRALDARYGLTAGYAIGFRDVSVRAKGGIVLGARKGLCQEQVDAIWARAGREIMVLNTVVHLRIASLPYQTRKALTARQREVLEWVGEGKTTQDIATIMGLTVATVEKHLRLARTVLKVDTTAQAVLKAASQNQIFIVPEFGIPNPDFGPLTNLNVT